MKHPITLFLILFVALAGFSCVAVSSAQAQDLNAIKQSMNNRLASVDALKASGAVGENNKGLLEVRSTTDAAATVVAAENADRQIVYAALAKNTGSTPEAVGVARAKQIAAASKPGLWLQSPKGDWYRK